MAKLFVLVAICVLFCTASAKQTRRPTTSTRGPRSGTVSNPFGKMGNGLSAPSGLGDVIGRAINGAFGPPPSPPPPPPDYTITIVVGSLGGTSVVALLAYILARIYKDRQDRRAHRTATFSPSNGISFG